MLRRLICLLSFSIVSSWRAPHIQKVLVRDVSFLALHSTSTDESLQEIQPALRIHVFDIAACDEPWTYEDHIRATVTRDDPNLVLLRWHISGPGAHLETLSVEAVTYNTITRS